MSKPGNEAGIAHEDVWDDSALLTSWNEALAEYKKYHSLAAQGKKVSKEDLDSIQAKYDQENRVHDGATRQNSHRPDTDPEPATAPTVDENAPIETATAPANASNAEAAVQSWPATAGNVHVPQALLSHVQDESLKNVMMSWYYAGYYTGLYEGQQKAYVSMQEQQGQRHEERG